MSESTEGGTHFVAKVQSSGRGVSLVDFTQVPSLKPTCSPLKMDGWNTIVSYWDGLFFSGAMLVSGRVYHTRNPSWIRGWWDRSINSFVAHYCREGFKVDRSWGKNCKLC